MLRVVILTLFVFYSALTHASETKFVTLANGQKLYIEYRVKDPSAPTIIFLHGLTYTTRAWAKLISSLESEDLNLLTYDMRGMGKTLEETGPSKEIIPLDAQVEDLNLLIQELKIQNPILVGLSYGGAVGLRYLGRYPQVPSQVVLMAPYVKALKALDDQVKQKIKMHRMIYPNDRKTDDELYDKYLKDIIVQTYPLYEPVVREHPWRLEAIYHMVQGVRKFKGTEEAPNLARHKLHLIVAERDQYVPKEDLPEFWNSLSSDQRLSQILVKESEHKIPEAKPDIAACWLAEIAKVNPWTQSDEAWIAYPSRQEIKGPRGTISCK